MMSRLVDRLFFVALSLLVLLSPIPLASNRYWSWSLLALLTSCLVLAWLALSALARRRMEWPLNPWIAISFVAVVMWAWLQAQGWLPENWHHPVWELTSEALGQSLPGAVSMAPPDNYTAIMRLLGYALVFFLAFQLGRDRKLARRAFWWVFIAGVMYSVYGLLSYWGVLREFLWYQDDAFGRDVRATFANRNHFANWLGIALICSLAAFFDHMLRAPQYPTLSMQSRQSQLDRFLKRSWAPLAGLVLMVSALVSTHSRGGFIATFCGGLVLLILIDRKLQTVSVRARVVGLSALAVSALAFFITNEVLIERFDSTDVDAEGRSRLYVLTAQGIGDNPVLGFGYGAYEDAFRVYRTDDIVKRVDRAHNTFLENAFELGIPMALLLFASILGLALTCFKGLQARHRDWVYPATGVAATVLVAVHANVDFGLQIPATAVLYALVMGVCCAQSFSSRAGMRAS